MLTYRSYLSCSIVRTKFDIYVFITNADDTLRKSTKTEYLPEAWSMPIYKNWKKRLFQWIIMTCIITYPTISTIRYIQTQIIDHIDIWYILFTTII